MDKDFVDILINETKDKGPLKNIDKELLSNELEQLRNLDVEIPLLYHSYLDRKECILKDSLSDRISYNKGALEDIIIQDDSFTNAIRTGNFNPIYNKDNYKKIYVRDMEEVGYNGRTENKGLTSIRYNKDKRGNFPKYQSLNNLLSLYSLNRNIRSPKGFDIDKPVFNIDYLFQFNPTLLFQFIFKNTLPRDSDKEVFDGDLDRKGYISVRNNMDILSSVIAFIEKISDERLYKNYVERYTDPNLYKNTKNIAVNDYMSTDIFTQLYSTIILANEREDHNESMLFVHSKFMNELTQQKVCAIVNSLLICNAKYNNRSYTMRDLIITGIITYVCEISNRQK